MSFGQFLCGVRAGLESPALPFLAMETAVLPQRGNRDRICLSPTVI